MSINLDTGRMRNSVRVNIYAAMCSNQGGRSVYSIRVPLGDLDTILETPDPDWTDEDNRKVSPQHAKDFGFYITKIPHDFKSVPTATNNDQLSWVAPALLARDSGSCTFESVTDDDSVGYLHVPWTTSGIGCLSIIDGQHRVLGVHLEFKRLTRRIYDIDRELGRTKSSQKREKLIADRSEIESHIALMHTQYIGVDIYREEDASRSRQMFVDVADNAKGISAAVRSRFDASQVANRTLDQVMKHALLKGHVDLDQDRMTRNNPNLLGAKHVADITRGVLYGIGGRTSKKKEQQLTDEQVVEQVNEFLDLLTDSFTDLGRVSEGTLTPAQLRERSLLGSVGILRVLAATYRKLRAAESDDDIGAFFCQLDRHMAAPVNDESIWRTNEKVNQSFEYGAYAPVMRTQNLGFIVDGLVDWYQQRPPQLLG